MVVEMDATSGTARPNACGHAITRTATSRSVANTIPASAKSQSTNVRVPAASAMPVRYRAALSESIWSRDLLACASATRRITPAKKVCSPILVTFTVRLPSPLIEPAITSASTDFDTGRDSPVIIDSSISDIPSTMTPSAGTFAPGLTSTMSPATSSESGTVIVVPSRMTSAISGKSFASSFSALCAPWTARISIQCPRSMMAINVESSQKRVCGSPRSVWNTLNAYAAVIASAIKVIIPGSFALISR